MILGIGHVDLVCTDVERSLAFYRSVFGPLGISEPALFDGERGEQIHYLRFPRRGSGSLGLRQALEEQEFSLYAPGFHHVAFRVESHADVDAAHAAAVAAGARVLHAPRPWPEYAEDYYAAFFLDPDGFRIEIASRADVRQVERAGDSVSIRRPRAGEGVRLRGIAVASKLHWGYSRDTVVAWVSRGTFTDEALAANDVRVADVDGVAVAWSALVWKNDIAWLEDLWVEPSFIGGGIGTRLFRDVLRRARAAGAVRLEWESEPHAVGFYERMGGRRVRDGVSEWGRVNPIMAVEF